MRRPLATAALASLLAVALGGKVLAGRPGADRAAALELAAKIDAALEQSWRDAGVEPSTAVDDLQFQRRLWLDALGTLPSLEEIRELEARPEQGRHAWLVDRALEDPRFFDTLAERLARIAVGAGRKPDDLLYRRRLFVHWLRDQVANGRTWDSIVREVIAAEGFSTNDPAVNFVFAQDADPNKLAGRTARSFLGVRIDCAQCHDHPFADWRQSDFEGIAAFFGRTKRKGPFLHDEKTGDYDIEDRKDGSIRRVEPHVPFAREVVDNVDDIGARKGPHNRREVLARWVTDARNPYFTRAIVNRAWSWLLGRGLIDPTDELDQSKPTVPAVLDLLEADAREHGLDLARIVRAIASTRAYALSSRLPQGGDREKHAPLFAVYPLKPLHPDQLAAALWQATSFVKQDDHNFWLFRVARADLTGKFVQRHAGDLDAEVPEDETLLQRYLLMNNQMLRERTNPENAFGPVRRLVLLAPSDARIIETAYLMVLSRKPTDAERSHFEARLAGKDNGEKARATQDLFWALLNSVEFAWNH